MRIAVAGFSVVCGYPAESSPHHEFLYARFLPQERTSGEANHNW
jgi:hypothetical protein